jgi:hypothetical protein
MAYITADGKAVGEWYRGPAALAGLKTEQEGKPGILWTAVQVYNKQSMLYNF